MTDIIASAKHLLDGATPAPWEPHADQPKCVVNLETQFAVAVVPESDVQGSEDESNRNLIAAAPELAAALAEESWEYSVETKRGKEWELVQDGFFNDAWYPELRKTKGHARDLASVGVEYRIVRRRVSPVEVINE